MCPDGVVEPAGDSTLIEVLLIGGLGVRFGLTVFLLLPPHSLVGAIRLYPMSFVFRGLFVVEGVGFRFVLATSALGYFFCVLGGSRYYNYSRGYPSNYNVYFSSTSSLRAVSVNLCIVR